ncbi:nicotinate phosphoribosyltransferase [soil metagenome]
MRTPVPPSPALAVNALSLGLDAFQAVTAAVHSGLANSRASFECVIHGDPSFDVIAGVEPLLDALERFRIKSDELTYLEGIGAIDAPVRQRLTDARFTCDVDAAPEGSLVFSGEPVVIVEGPFWQVQLVEAWVRGSLDAATSVATHFAHCALVAEDAEVIEIGTPLLNRLGGAPLLSRAAFVGCAGASTNALAGSSYGVQVRARQPPSFILASKSETTAFEHWLKSATEQPILRIDVRDAVGGIDRAVNATRSRATASWSDAPIVVELHADLVVELAPVAAERFAKAGLKEPVLVVRGANSPARIAELRATGVPIAAFVVETPSNERQAMRFDVAAVDEGGQWSPRIRLGDRADSSTVPGRKVVLRYFDAEGHPVGDIVHASNERHLAPKDAKLVDHHTGFTVKLKYAATSAPLLVQMMRAGKRLQATEPARESRERALRATRSLLPRHRRILSPASYPCGVTALLASARSELASKVRER